MTKAHYLRIGALCGLPRKDALLSAPGELGDLWELYLRANGVGRKTEPGG